MIDLKTLNKMYFSEMGGIMGKNKVMDQMIYVRLYIKMTIKSFNTISSQERNTQHLQKI